MNEQLSRISENYIRAIYDIVESKGYVRVKDIANSLNVKSSSVISMLEKLDKIGIINYKKYEGITLTENGRKIASTINEKYKIFLKLFEIAGVSPQTAYKDACLLEHYVSRETNESISDLIELLQKNGIKVRRFNG